MATVETKQPLQARMSSITSRPLRIALVGCGAISQQMHLPVLAGHETLRLAALVDQDAGRARRFAKQYGVERVFDDAAALSRELVDAAIIATPPFHHAPCAIQLMQKGIHVLVEKPMATSLADAERMVEVAHEHGVVLACSLFRRLYPSIGLVKSLLESGWLGSPLKFDLEGGAIYAWNAATLGNMRKEFAGGGVLMDMGSHYLDQLVAIFGHDCRVLQYRDNSLGGIESDCTLELELQWNGQKVPASVELSRTRNLRNTLRIECERGEIQLGFSDRYQVSVKEHRLRLNDPHTDLRRDYAMRLSWADQPEQEWYESFRAEIDDWAGAIASDREPELSGRSALMSLRLIEQCYRQKVQLPEPWVEHPLRDRESGTKRQPRRVLITGATGFIGCRVAEILSGRAGYDVRCLVHNPANAGRLSRLPVELIQGDICDRSAMREAVHDCDIVIHCAIGTTYWDWNQVAEITVGGTRNLIDAARAAGIMRIIHLSSIAVHGNPAVATLDENSPLRPDVGDRYGRSKLAAEQLVRDAAAGDLRTVVLRPGCVYGPFGTTFITRPIEYLLGDRLVLENSADTPSNTVYVDNLVQAIVEACERDMTEANDVFVLADDDGTTWGDFFGFFADALDAQLRIESASRSNGAVKRKRRGFLRGVSEVLRSPQFKQFGKKVLDTDPIGRLPRFMLERTPGLERFLRHKLGSDESVTYRRPHGNAPFDDLRIRPRHAAINCERIRQKTGYRAHICRADALARTLAWLRYARIVPR